MKDVTLENITDAVIQSIDGTQDARLKQLLTVFTRKAHEAVRETGLTQDEWVGLVDFMRRSGEISTEQRNEFILLSDLFGVSSLVDLMNAAKPSEGTVSSLLGPFYVPGAPLLPVGGDMIGDNDGDRIVVQGRVLSASGEPIAGAELEFWQNAANGLYSNTDPDQDDDNLRRRMFSGDDGGYSLSTIRPIAYKVPEDGPGAEIVRATGRHSWRPAYLHAQIQANGHKPLITEMFNAADDYIEEDAVFGVRGPLAVPFDRDPTADESTRFAHVAEPFHMVDFDIVLQPAE